MCNNSNDLFVLIGVVCSQYVGILQEAIEALLDQQFWQMAVNAALHQTIC
jgi:hypothetical protein